jgi:hypothetical protein
LKQTVHDLNGGAQDVAWALLRRGMAWAGGNGERELLFAEAGLQPPELEAFYQQMHSYAFRLFLRDLIHHRSGFGMEDLLRYVNAETAARYLGALAGWRLIEPIGDGRWRLGASQARSFGETLEWYVAQLFSRGFGCTAAWGVRATWSGTGGDYDVLALIEGRLACVEVKSSPPKHITVETVANFLRRIEELGPALSIFLEDTHLRLEDKVLPLFAEALGRPGESDGLFVCERRHLYSIRLPAAERNGHSPPPLLFVFSSRPSLEANLAHCLRRLLVPGAPPLLHDFPEDVP